MRFFFPILLFLLITGFNISAQTAGDVRSSGSGPWTTVTNWEVFNGSTWVSAASAPSSSSQAIEIQSSHSINIPSGSTVSADQLTLRGTLIIDNGANLSLTNGPAIDLVIDNASATLLVNGTLTRQNLSEVSNPFGSGNIVFGPGATYNHRYTTTVGDLPSATWNETSTLLFSAFSNTTLISANATWNQSFGNVTYNCSGQRAVVDFAGNIRVVRGDLTIAKTGNNVVQMGSNQIFTLSVGQEGSSTGGSIRILSNARVNFGTTGTVTVDVYRDFFFNSTNTAGSFLTVSGVTSVNIYGTYSMTAGNGGRIRLAGSGKTGIGNLNLYGDFTVNSGRVEEIGSNPTHGTINFLKNGVQNFYNKGSFIGYFKYYVAPGSTVNLGVDPIEGSVTSTFTLAGTIVLGSLETRGAIAPGYYGNIQIPKRTYLPGSTIVYGAGSTQYLGTDHPSGNVTTVINNNAGVRLTGPKTLAGHLRLQGGSLVLAGNAMTLSGTYENVGGNFAGNVASSLIIAGTGTGDFGNLAFAHASNQLGTLTINRQGTGVTVGLNGSVRIGTAVNLTRGAFRNEGTLQLADGVVVTRYPMSSLTNSGFSLASGDNFDLVYRSISPASGPFANFTTGLELHPTAIRNFDLQMARPNDVLEIVGNFEVDGLFNLNLGSLVQNGNVLMNGPTWNDNLGNLVPGSGFVIFNAETSVDGTSNTLFGHVQANPGASVTFLRNFNIEGNVNFQAGSTIETNSVVATFSGGNPQTISANGATFDNIDIAKSNSQGVFLTSQLNLSGLLQFVNPSSNVNLQSNGHLHLLSTSDAPGSGTARIYRLLNSNRISGNVVVNRFMSPEMRMWRYISSPVTNASVAQLMDDFFVGGNFADPSPKAVICGKTAPSNSTTIYYYNEAEPGGMDDGYVAYPRPGVTAAASPLQVGLGYSVFIRNCDTPTIIDYTGPINQGTLSLPVTYTPNDPEGFGWNLVGNPYPSAVNWDAGWTKGQISPQIAIRDYAADVFRYYEEGVTDELPNGQIAIGQAFWVRATGANPVLQITENAKVTTVPEFFREAAPQIPNFMIALSDGTREDYAYVKTVANAKLSLDEFDAPKIMNQTISFSTVASDMVPMAINAVESLTCGMLLPLRTDGLERGTYTLRLDTREYFSEFAFVLNDHYTGQEVVLTSELFEFVVGEDPASAASNRFELRIEERKAFSDVAVATENVCGDFVTVSISDADPNTKYSVWSTSGLAVSDVFTARSSRLSIAVSADSIDSNSAAEFVIKAFNACGSEAIVSSPFVVNRTLPQISLDARRDCETGEIELTASASDANVVIRWYEREGDAVPVHTGHQFVVGDLKKAKTYFAEALNGSGCVSVREKIVAEVPPTVEATLTVVGTKLVTNQIENNRWYFNDEVIAENAASVDLRKNGQYRVELNVGGCISVLSHYQEEIPGIRFYPNPVADKLTIEGISDDVQEIALVNSLGVNVMTVYRQGQNFAGEINVQSLPDGVYLLIISEGSGKLSHRLVKGLK